jgi:hypothetical protein
MTSALAIRQHALVDALLCTDAAEGLGLIGLPGVQSSGLGSALERGLLAYRLNAQAVAAKALAAVFGRTQAALGDDEAAAMAWALWRRYPPQQGDLGQWGEALPAFLAEQDGMPQWLCDLARIEWAAHRCERAADCELDADSLALLSEVEPRDLRLRLRPGVQLLRVTPQAWAFWAQQEEGSEPAGDSLGLVMARMAWVAQAHVLSDSAWVLMSSLLEGVDIDLALQQAFAQQADFDFSAWLQAALLNGWLLGAERLLK